MKTVFATIGLVAVLGAAYFISTGKSPEAIKEIAGTTAPKEPEQKPRTPLDWTMEEIQAKPEEYFSYALEKAKKNRAEVKAKEAQLRISEKEFARKSAQKKSAADGLTAMLAKAKEAYRAADEKYGDSPQWVALFPDAGTRLKKPQMKMQIVRINKRAKQAQDMSEKYLGVNQRYRSTITVAEQKGFELDMAIDDLSNNLERVRANEALSSITVNQEEINKYLDMSEVYNEMEDMGKALDNLSMSEGIAAGNDADFEKLMAE